MAKRTQTIGIRVTPDVKSAIALAADRQNRSIASMVETVLVAYLSSSGYLKNGHIAPKEFTFDDTSNVTNGSGSSTRSGSADQ